MPPHAAIATDSAPAPPPPEGATAAARRAAEARHVALDVLDRRERGEAVLDEDVLRAHPGFLPELADELRAAAAVRHARVAAGKSAPILEPVPILSDAELESPIETSLGLLAGETPASGPHRAAASDAGVVAVPGYGVLQEIGRGGQGGVYRAVQESTGRIVALKVLSDGVLAAPRHRARFEREAQILAALNHPNVVAIVDRVRTLDSSACLVMEYVEGRDLDDYWANCVAPGPTGTAEVLRLFCKLCLAVEEAHARGIVHRDLKPSNVRVDARGEPHVLDFGLARAAGPAAAAARTMTVTGQIVGSVPWASPEQAAGESGDVDAASDVYSLGVMLYQALAGRFPYDVAGPIRSVLNNIALVDPAPPGRVNPARRIGRSLDAVVLKALAKRPADRYASAGALARDLQNVLDARPVSAPAPRPWRLLWPALAVAGLLASGTLSLERWAGPSGPVRVIPLATAINSDGMKMIRISPGLVALGNPPRENGIRSDEPEQVVVIDHHFWVGATEVTQRQYEEVMRANPSDPRARGPDLPVQCVTWDEAAEFCRRLSAREGRVYRLPTEAEWEYACRAGLPGEYAGGIKRLGDSAWYNGNSGGVPRAVAGLSPNAWGLFDMMGNVAEWCADGPTPPRWAPVMPGWHVSRGGSAEESPERCRPGTREIHVPGARRRDVGFRVLMEDPASKSSPAPGVQSVPPTPGGGAR